MTTPRLRAATQPEARAVPFLDALAQLLADRVLKDMRPASDNANSLNATTPPVHYRHVKTGLRDGPPASSTRSSNSGNLPS